MFQNPCTMLVVMLDNTRDETAKMLKDDLVRT